MQVNKTILASFAAALCLTLSLGDPSKAAADKKPVEIEADVIDYNTTTGIMTAQGNVKLTQDGAVMTGSQGEYDTKKQEAYIYGGVTIAREGATLTASEVRSYENNNHLIAAGNAVLTKDANRATGPKMDYYVDKNYVVLPEAGRVTTADGTMTADYMFAYLNDNRMEGKGNVHLVSEAQSLDATADEAVYYGGQNGQGKAVLSGNARALQNGNLLTGSTLTIVDGKAMSAEGNRPKLVIIPQ